MKKCVILTIVLTIFLIFLNLLPNGNKFFGIVYAKSPSDVGYGEWNDIPSPYGDVYVFEAWQLITNSTTKQYKLREQAGQNFDSEGYGVINGCYVIATTNIKNGGLAKVGDFIDFQLSNGQTISCIVGEAKDPNDKGCTIWGHKNGRNVIEFIVDHDTWYNTGHQNPGQGNGQLDSILKGTRTTKYIRKGNYFDGYRGGAVQSASTSGSIDTESNTFEGALGSLFRNFWNAVSTLFENSQNDRDDVTVLYSFKQAS